MSASRSCSSESPESKVKQSNVNNNCINSRYALYLFSNNKHASSTDSGSSDNSSVNINKYGCKGDFEDSSICLSLLEGNLGAEQETVVRCYLLKTLSSRDDLGFENGGKYAELQFSSGDPDETFGCYYHRLSKHSTFENSDLKEEEEKLKCHTFFICLIGPSHGVMDLFCTELGKFCCSLIPLLDPEGLKNRDNVQLKLKSWYFHSVEYIGRCIDRLNEDLISVLHCSLWGSLEVISEDSGLKWDIERFFETCCLMPESDDGSKGSAKISATNHFTMQVVEGKIKMDKALEDTTYSMKWFDKLKNSNLNDPVALRNILENFRLKTVQDLNTLKRLLQKAQTDHYSLYRAFRFLRDSGYEDILLFHVEREAVMAGEQEILHIITCLNDFLKEKRSSHSS